MVQESPTLMTEADGSSERCVHLYRIARCHPTQDTHQKQPMRDKSNISCRVYIRYDATAVSQSTDIRDFLGGENFRIVAFLVTNCTVPPKQCYTETTNVQHKTR